MAHYRKAVPAEPLTDAEVFPPSGKDPLLLYEDRRVRVRSSMEDRVITCKTAIGNLSIRLTRDGIEITGNLSGLAVLPRSFSSAFIRNVNASDS